MKEVILLVSDTPEGLELQKRMIEVLNKNFPEAIVLPGGVKKPSEK